MFCKVSVKSQTRTVKRYGIKHYYSHRQHNEVLTKDDVARRYKIQKAGPTAKVINQKQDSGTGLCLPSDVLLYLIL